MTATILVMAFSINTISASFVFASETQEVKATQTISSSSTSNNATIIKKDKSLNSDSNIVTPNSVPTAAIKKAYKWAIAHWDTIKAKVPEKFRKYLPAAPIFVKAADKFLGVSDSIEDFFHDTFRSLGMPETANWAITNVIMVIIPI